MKTQASTAGAAQAAKMWRRTWLIMCVVVVSLFLFLDPGLHAEDKTIDKPIFYIERNKNRNLVQYAVRMLPQSCEAASDEPVYGYWRDLEEGPNVTSPLLWYETPAYGFKSQEVRGNVVEVRLRALPERPITVALSKNDLRCSAQATIEINGQPAMLEKIYVFAEEGWVKPTVKWIEVRGSLSGEAVIEHIVVD